MAIQTLSTIKNWFKIGLKPTQAQFWDTWDSFRHKNEKVNVADVTGLDELLTGVSSVMICKPTQLLIFKRSPNQNNSILESGDFVMGIVEKIFINGTYRSGNTTLLENFDITNQIEFNNEEPT
jgi:hypothetical protein